MQKFFLICDVSKQNTTGGTPKNKDVGAKGTHTIGKIVLIEDRSKMGKINFQTQFFSILKS